MYNFGSVTSALEVHAGRSEQGTGCEVIFGVVWPRAYALCLSIHVSLGTPSVSVFLFSLRVSLFALSMSILSLVTMRGFSNLLIRAPTHPLLVDEASDLHPISLSEDSDGDTNTLFTKLLNTFAPRYLAPDETKCSSTRL